MKILIPLILILSLNFVFSLLPKYPHIYQVSARAWLYSLSQQEKRNLTLNEIPDSVFEDLNTKGFDFLYLLGVWSLGEIGLKIDQGNLKDFKPIFEDVQIEDIIGSPFAITNYTCNIEICPNGDEDLVNFRKRLRKYNIKLLLDFVPNHSAIDSPLVHLYPSFYIRMPTNEKYDNNTYYKINDTLIIAYGGMKGATWYDVLQLNYWDLGLRTFMTQQLMKIASLADGIRCDSSSIVFNDYFGETWNTQLSSYGYQKPQNEFWGQAIGKVKTKYPNTIFITETDSNDHLKMFNQGFDYSFEKTLIDKLLNPHLDDTRYIITSLAKYNHQLCRYLENHDNNRFFSRIPESRIKAAIYLTYTLPGLRFFFQDQWLGLKNRLDIHLRRSQPEDGSSVLRTFYTNFLFNFLKKDVMKNGEWSYVNIVESSNSWRLMAWKWLDKNTETKYLIVICYNEMKCEGQIKIDDTLGKEGDSINVKELVSGIPYERDVNDLKNKGLYVVVGEWNAQIFEYK